MAVAVAGVVVEARGEEEEEAPAAEAVAAEEHQPQAQHHHQHQQRLACFPWLGFSVVLLLLERPRTLKKRTISRQDIHRRHNGLRTLLRQ